MDQRVHRRKEAAIFKIGRDAHRYGEVIMAHPRDVHARNANDVVQILKSLGGFEQKNHRYFFVRLCKKGRSTRAVQVMRDPQRDASTARRGVFQLDNYIFRLRSRFHSGNHHTACTQVENPRKRRVSKIRNTRDRIDAATAARTDHLGQQCYIAAPVFHVIDDEVEPSGGQDRTDARREELQDHLAEDPFPAPELLTKRAHTAVASAALYRWSFFKKPGRVRTSRFTT